MPNQLAVWGDSIKAVTAIVPRLSFPVIRGGGGGYQTPVFFPNGLIETGFAGTGASGPQYNFETLMENPLSNSVIAACVDAYTRAYPDAPLVLEQLVEHTDEKGIKTTAWERVDSHPALDIFRPTDPSSLSETELWGLKAASCLTRGEAFWFLAYNNAGSPAAIIPKLVSEVQVEGDKDHFISNYKVLDGDGEWQDVPPSQIVHFRHLVDVYNNRRGWTPLSTGRAAMVGDNTVSTYHASVLLNAGVMSLLISLKQGVAQGAAIEVTPAQMQAFVDNWRRKYFGNKAASGGIEGTSMPLDVTKMGYSPDEMGVEKLTDYFMRRLHALMGVSPKITDMGDDPTYLNLEAAQTGFWELRIVPDRNKDADTLNRQLLPLFGLDPAKWRYAFDFSKVVALQENLDELFNRWRSNFDSGACDLYTFQTKIGETNVPDTYKNKFAKALVTLGEAPQAQGAPTTPEVKYSSDQPRDYHGMWESGGGLSSQPHAFEQMHEWRGDALPEVETEAFQKGKVLAIKKVLPYAKPGSMEAATVVLKHDGSLGKFAIGAPDSVEIEADATEKVALFHTHPDNNAHSVKDFTDFLSFPNMEQSHVIGTSSTFGLHKPADWRPEAYGLEEHRLSDIEGESDAILERNYAKIENEHTRHYVAALQRMGGWSVQNEEGAREEATRNVAAHFGVKFRVGERK
ncbi:hypothetical protein IAD21_00902 [Abditibacteriota bacterium]|nr:hypothetical protein IAD21_00902 [Abditibacteriota bacterium]